MGHYNTIMNQLLKNSSRHEFQSIVNYYSGDHRVHNFDCWSQFVTMLYAQLTNQKSLRDLEMSLHSNHHKWYHLGLKSIRRSTLADANTKRSWMIYRDYFEALLASCKRYAPKHKFKFKNNLYSLDSTTVDLCLSLFPWATFRRTKGALKIHTLLDHSGYLPSFIYISEGKVHDINIARKITLPPSSILLTDRAYTKFKWFANLHKQGVFFIIRAKDNLNFKVTERRRVDKSKGLLCDQSIVLKGYYQSRDYPQALRRIGFRDPETGKYLVFLTNNFKLSVKTITDLYKERWQIEIFFKYIKENLKIKTFLGTSVNAVMTQIFIAMCAYLMMAFLKFLHSLTISLSKIKTLIQVNIFAKLDLVDLLSLKITKPPGGPPQLPLFEAWS